MENLEVKNVDVLGSQIMAAKDTNNIIWVGVRWMCQGMGMTAGQWKRQITNIQKDLLLKRGGSNLILPTASGEQEVFCLQNEYLPIWLAKISITPTIQKEHPELAEKLLEYQLKAKDILANAFIEKKATENPATLQRQIQLIAQGTTELYEKVDTLSDRMDKFENDLPLFPEEADNVSGVVKRRVVEVLGGKDSDAYHNRSLCQSVFMDAYRNLKRNFNVRSYKAIKRRQISDAIRIAAEYNPPLYLANQILDMNAQTKLDL